MTSAAEPDAPGDPRLGDPRLGDSRLGDTDPEASKLESTGAEIGGAVARGAHWVVQTTRKGHLLLTRGTESVGLDLRRGQIESLRSGSREVLAEPFHVVLAHRITPSALRRRALIRERAKRVKRSLVTESAEGVDVAFELKSRWGSASLVVRADAGDGILLQLRVHAGGEIERVGIRTRLDGAFDQVRWGRRVRPAADSRRADRVGWHRRTLRELLGAAESEVRSSVEHVEVADEAARLRVASEGSGLLRFAVRRGWIPRGLRRSAAEADGSHLDVDLDTAPGAAPTADGEQDAEHGERVAALRLTWGSPASAA